MGQVAGGVAGVGHQPAVALQHAVHGRGQAGELLGEAGVQALGLAILHPAKVGAQAAQRGQPPADLQRQGGQQQRAEAGQGECQQAVEADDLAVQRRPGDRHGHMQRCGQRGEADVAFDGAQRRAARPREVAEGDLGVGGGGQALVPQRARGEGVLAAVAGLPVPAREDPAEARLAQVALQHQLAGDLVPGQPGDDHPEQRLQPLVEGGGGGGLDMAGEGDAGEGQRDQQDRKRRQHQPAGQGEATSGHGASSVSTRR